MADTTPPDPRPAARLQGVSVSFGGLPVLDDVDLTIDRGDLVCVIGPNGGGKSTLLRLLVGALRPNRGDIEVLGKKPTLARSRVGYMPQHSHLDPQFPVTVLDVVLMGRIGRGAAIGRWRRTDVEIARRSLVEVGIDELRDRRFASLSGGQRQRTLIARSLACQPEILLLDEPTAGLDPAVQDDLYRTLRDLGRDLTIVVVSHDLGFVSVIFRTVVCVHRSVHAHPREDLTERRVAEMYGRPVRLVHPGWQPESSP